MTPLEIVLAIAIGAQSGSAAATGDAPPRPPVVVVLVDALRADRLKSAGGDGRATPNLERFAADSAVTFTDAISVSSWTKPSIPSLFTRLYPCQHGVYRGDSKSRDGKLRADTLPDEAFTLAEAFRAAGYRTGAVVENAQISARFGMAQGFDVYEEGAGDARSIREKTLAWLAGVPASEPYFLYVHFLDIHWPLRPRAEDAARFPLEPGGRLDMLAPDWRALHDALADGEAEPNAIDRKNAAALYDSCLLAVDRELGAILDAVRARPGGASAVVVVTADHGEALLESGRLGHGHSLDPELLRIPLIVSGPGLPPGTRRKDPVSLVDVMPTVLELAGLPVPEGIPGVSLARKEAHPGRLRLAEQRVRALLRLALVANGYRYEREVRKERERLEDPRGAAPTGPAFATGARVKVAATRGAEGTLVAHKARAIESDDDDLEVEGVLEAADRARGRLRIGGFDVIFGEREAEKSRSRGLLGLEAYEMLAPGDVVKAEGDALPSGELRAVKLERAKSSDLSPSGEEVEIEGRAADVSEKLTKRGVPSAFRLGFVSVSCDDDTRFRRDEASVEIVAAEDEGPTLEESRIGGGLLPGVIASERLFDWGGRDAESKDLSRTKEMSHVLDALLRVLERKALRPAPRTEIDEKTEAELKRLGYVR